PMRFISKTWTTAKTITGHRAQTLSKPVTSRRLSRTRPPLSWTFSRLSIQPQWMRGSCSSPRARCRASGGLIRTAAGHLPPLACFPASPLSPKALGSRALAPRRGARVSMFPREDTDAHALALRDPDRLRRSGGVAGARGRARHGGPALLSLDTHHRRSVRGRRALASDHPAHQAAWRQRGRGGARDQQLRRGFPTDLSQLPHPAPRRGGTLSPPPPPAARTPA